MNLFKKCGELIIKNKFLIIAVIIFLSVFPRSIEVLNQNPIFGFDQGREMLAAKNIVVNHKLILIGTEIGAGSAGISGIFQGPVYYYLLTIPFVIFNGNPVGAVVLMLIFGLLSICLGYFLGKKLFGNFGGILVSLLMSISPVLISQSRFIWSPNPPTLFILLTFLFAYKFLKKNNLYIFLAAFFAGFIYNFEIAIAVPLSLTLLIYSIYVFRSDFKRYLYLLTGFLLAYLPMIMFEVRHGFMGIRGLVGYILKHPSSGPNNSSFILDHFKSFIFNFKETFPMISFEISLVLFVMLIFLVVYLLRKEKDAQIKGFMMFILLLIPVSFFVFYFLKNTVWSYYLTDLSITYILLLSYLIFSLHKLGYVKLNVLLVGLVFIFLLLGFYNAVKTSIYDYSDYGGTAKIKGEIDAIDFIYRDAKGKPFGVLVFSPPVYTYPYDYLFWWYGQRKYNYIPYGEKKGTFYLLIQPDGEKPWSYKGWLETVIKTGKIIYTKTLPSGFIIQKRIENG